MSDNNGVVIFLTRKEAGEKINASGVYKRPRWYVPGNRIRNYEFEQELFEITGVVHCISEWCPFDGRFCRLARYVPYPHPPLGDSNEPMTEKVNRPWSNPSSQYLRDNHYYVAACHRVETLAQCSNYVRSDRLQPTLRSVNARLSRISAIVDTEYLGFLGDLDPQCLTSIGHLLLVARIVKVLNKLYVAREFGGGMYSEPFRVVCDTSNNTVEALASGRPRLDVFWQPFFKPRPTHLVCTAEYSEETQESF